MHTQLKKLLLIVPWGRKGPTGKHMTIKQLKVGTPPGGLKSRDALKSAGKGQSYWNNKYPDRKLYIYNQHLAITSCK